MSAGSFITASRLAASYTLPAGLAQTELRRGSAVQVASFQLAQGQVAVMRYLSLNLLRLLSYGVTPDVVNTPFGLATVGLYAGTMLTCPLLSVTATGLGCVATDPYKEIVMASPGVYSVVVVNNTGRATVALVQATGGWNVLRDGIIQTGLPTGVTSGSPVSLFTNQAAAQATLDKNLAAVDLSVCVTGAIKFYT